MPKRRGRPPLPDAATAYRLALELEKYGAIGRFVEELIANEHGKRGAVSRAIEATCAKFRVQERTVKRHRARYDAANMRCSVLDLPPRKLVRHIALLKRDALAQEALRKFKPSTRIYDPYSASERAMFADLGEKKTQELIGAYRWLDLLGPNRDK